MKTEQVEKGTPETVLADPIEDPLEFPSSVPENTIIALEHNGRFDSLKYSDSLNKMASGAADIQKPRLIGKAREVFQWPRNEKWRPVQRLTDLHQCEGDADPWKNERYLEVVKKYAGGSEKQKGSKWQNKAVWYFAYKDSNHEDDAPFDNFTTREVLIISWMCALKNAEKSNHTQMSAFFQYPVKSVYQGVVQEAVSHRIPSHQGGTVGHAPHRDPRGYDLRIKKPEGEDTENMKKGLAILKEAMTNLKIAWLRSSCRMGDTKNWKWCSIVTISKGE